MAIIKFWGLPIGVAEDPIFALEANASKKGWGGILFCLAVFKMNSVRMTQVVSLVNNALESAETMQILQSKSLGPRLFHENNAPKYLNMSALSR